MEVCGTHTMAISKYGLRKHFKNTELISGPGCPVCVTPSGRLEQCVSLAKKQNVIITTFGDMLRVPAVTSTLEKEAGKGADIRIVYSAYESLETALKNPSKDVVFIGAGFETTAPLAAFIIQEAYKKKVLNFSVFSMFKTVFPALEAIASSKDLKVDGFILPGNVASVTGYKNFAFLAEKHNIPCVVTGFFAKEIKEAVNMLKLLISSGKAAIVNKYESAVSAEGNLKAKEMLTDVFDLKDDVWRGFGIIKQSGFGIKDKYKAFDAEKKFKLKPVKEKKDKCICGDIMKGKALPANCLLFAKACTPQNPVGPCMVSSEGVCAAYYKYN